MADRRAQIEARLAAAEADAERHRRLAEQWKEVADAADDVIRAVLAALYRGPDTDAVIRAKKVMAERDALAAKLADVWDEGFDAGHQSARAVNPEWPEMPRNPHRIERGES